MRTRLLLASGVLILTLVFDVAGAQAAPPGNDDFAHATAITTTPFSATAEITEATTEQDEPITNPDVQRRTIWYSYTPSSAAVVEINPPLPPSTDPPTLCDLRMSGDFLVVYRQDGTGFAGLTRIAGDPLSNNTRSTFDVAAGATYFFQAGEYGQFVPDCPNTFSLRMTVTASDRTPPTLTVSGISLPATSPAAATVTYTVAATDDRDPYPIVSCVPGSVSIIPNGATTVTCTATDASGNSAGASFTVLVKGAAEQLADLRAAVTGVVPGKGLAITVGIAEWLVVHGQRRAACTALKVFVYEVQALSRKKLSPTVAAALIADASRVRAVLSC